MVGSATATCGVSLVPVIAHDLVAVLRDVVLVSPATDMTVERSRLESLRFQ